VSKEFFRVDASLMQQLGASLIADDLQCLVELIKNAYDADAQLVRVVIDAPDKIIVEDNGHGMDRKTIRRGWLTISNSLKAEQKRRGELTPIHGRTPLGDKGLGRLSTQRLGNRLRIESVARGSDTLTTVDIDWSAFSAGSDLTEVPVELVETSSKGRSAGTRVTISHLVNADGWTRMLPATLRTSLATLVSPYSEIASFRIQAFLNGTEVTPEIVASNIRRAAIQHFRFKFDGEALVTSGEIMKSTIRGGGATSEEFQEFFVADHGQRFLGYLLKAKGSASYSLTAAESSDNPVLCRFRVERKFSDIAGTSENPGSFFGEIDNYYLDQMGSGNIADVAALDSRSVAKQMVKDLSGIKVYRDGFVIRTDHDWLGLRKSQTSGGSFYALRPENTMGYIAISARDNARLSETTDRQAFVEDDVYRSFESLLLAVVSTANNLLEHVRRTWNEFIKAERIRVGELPSSDPKQVEARLEASFSKVTGARRVLQKVTDVLSAVAENDSASLFPANPKTVEQLSDVQELIAEATETLDDVSKHGGLTRILVAELDKLNERLGEVYELVSLGITAEALSHDISVILERLSLETASVQKYGKVLRLEDAKILRYFEVVRSTVSALEKQLGHLDPAMRYTREKREVFSVRQFLEDASGYYRTRFEDKGISLVIVDKHDFEVTINRGKLIQILDNLILNSEYWLTQLPKRSRASSSVTITADKPHIVVEDSGNGIELAFEETLFDPFVTAKPKGQGRGLGLFIASQLLELDGCSIELLPNRNSLGRRFKLAINLTGALSNG